MHTLRFTLVAGMALGLATACGDDSATDAARPKARPRPALAVADAEAAAPEAEYRYDPTGKPDPFKSFVKRNAIADPSAIQSPLERFDLSQLLVTGVIWAASQPRALVQDPTGKGYVVAAGAAIGKNKGRVVRIDDNKVVVKETYVDAFDKATTKEVEMVLYERHGG